MRLAHRRQRNILITLFAVAIAVLLLRSYGSLLHHPQWLSGWLLIILIVFLGFYNIRKKLSIIPLGRNAAWLQLHLYIGLFSMLMFLEHISWSLPSGVLGWVLALLFFIVILTGIFGIYFSRRLPKELTRRGEEVIFERIPHFRAELQQQAEQIVLNAAKETGSSTLADFYSSRLALFFQGPRNYFKHLLHIGRPLYGLVNDIKSQYRYLNDNEVEYAKQLLGLVEQKDELDFHFALQATLKGWLFIHVPITYSMLIIIILHVLLVYAFGMY